jgi:hypothetical protein
VIALGFERLSEESVDVDVELELECESTALRGEGE